MQTLWREHTSQVDLLEKENMGLDLEWGKKVEERPFLEEDQRVEEDYLHNFND